ncbi:MAG: DNA-binding transcriptional ArsR family regulator [Kiritimatiellia bacterium]|jgi:DNA-binding transcriptional ArsR family regulator
MQLAPDVFRAISDPTRRAMLDQLHRGDLPSGSLADGFDMSHAAVSQHLKVLRDAGLVRARKDGRRRIYCLQPGGLQEVYQWVEHYRAFWEHRLDALGVLLDQDAP